MKINNFDKLKEKYEAEYKGFKSIPKTYFTFKRNKKIMAIGVFDLLHIGHLRFLKRASKLGDLYVGVLLDSHLKKWKRIPIYPEKQRYEMLTHLPYIKKLFYVGENSYEVFMETLKPDLVVHGSDWKDAPSILLAKKLGIKTKIIKSTPNISTTKIIEKIRNAKS